MDETVFTMGKELDMKEEMKRTLATPKLPANVMLKIMFLTFDLLYGKARSLPKVLVLEILARYPYWAWEHGVTGHFKTSHLWADQNQPVIVKIDIMIGGQLSTPVFSVARSLSR